MRAWAWSVLFAVTSSALGCVTVDDVQRQQYAALSPESRDQYDKYRQFMTELQCQQYLGFKSDADRQEFVRNLHIEERVARYPEYVQKAIWSRTPVVGMDKTALFLTLGRPDSVDRDDIDPETHILPTERWYYRRGALANQAYVITIVNDEITEVKEPQVK